MHTDAMRFTSEEQYAVAKFMQAVGQGIETKPKVITDRKLLDLRIELVREEFEELLSAATGAEASVILDYGPAPEKPADLVATADAMCDLLYVLYGWAVAAGIDLKPIFDRVHASNMAKLGGPVREDGKRLKPPGWQPPDVKGALEEQGWKP